MPHANARPAAALLVSRESREPRACPGPMKVFVAASVATSILFASARGGAQPTPVLELHWEAPSQCPQNEAVQERIRALVGGAEVRPELLRAEGRIAQSGDKFRLLLIVRSGAAAGIRTLESDSCDDLTGAAAVGLGLLVRRARTATAPLTSEALGSSVAGEPQAPPTVPQDDAPSSRGGAGAQLPAETHVAEAAPAAVPSMRPAKPSRAVVASGRALMLRLPAVVLDVLTLPGISTGYALGAGARVSTWQVLVTLAYFPRRSVGNHWPAPGANVTRYALHGDGCREWRYRAFEWGPCFHAGVSRVVASGTGQGLTSVESTALVWSAGAALDAKAYLAPWLAAFITASGEFQTPRPRLVNEEIGELYRFPLVGLRFVLGSEWLF